MQDSNLKEYLDSKQAFKLILGANNENYREITNLTALYSLAGCRFFDINASYEALNAAVLGLEYSKKTNCSLCISVGANDDLHLSKCKINPSICTKCNICSGLCVQGAIKDFKIEEKKCIGCSACKNACKYGAIEVYQKSTPWQENFEIFKKYCSCVEFHIMSKNIEEINTKWDFLCSNFDGFLSISVNHSTFGNIDLIKQLKAMLQKRKPYTTIIQADGVPMSGTKEDYRTTLQAIAMADFIERENLQTYIHVSGGTNTLTKKLSDKFNININGVAMGSYARKAVREYIEKDDFLKNKKAFNKALKIAKKIIKSTR